MYVGWIAVLTLCLNPSQIVAITMKDIDDMIARGPFAANWSSITSQYKVPKWYLDGKFGVYTHWLISSVPAYGNEWYPRRMYQKGSNEYTHHLNTYGDLDLHGFKHFISNFTAEHFDAHEWMDLFKRAGAKFAGPVGEHHDGFAMYNCSLSPYNAVNMGPKRDIGQELREAAADNQIHYLMSSHRAWHSAFYDGGRAIPDSDVAKCKCSNWNEDHKPNNTQENASEDPAYCIMYCPANPDEKTPTEAYCKDWLLRTCEMADRYLPEVLYFDWWIGVSPVWQPWIKKLAAYYYNRLHLEDKVGVINTKDSTMPPGADVLDFERGQACQILKNYWQTDTSVSVKSWGYINNDQYKSGISIIHSLVDIVSKNGALLLNVGPPPNGSIPLEAVKIFDQVGKWLTVIGESIYGTRPYHIFGEGPTQVGCGSFSDTEHATFTIKDFRFTVEPEKSFLYVTALGGKSDTTLLITSLDKRRVGDGSINNVILLGYGTVKWNCSDDGLFVELPSSIPSQPPVLKIMGMSDIQWDGIVRQGADSSFSLWAVSTDDLNGGVKLAVSGQYTSIINWPLHNFESSFIKWTVRVRAKQQFTVKVLAASPDHPVDLELSSSDSSVIVTAAQTNNSTTYSMSSATQPFNIASPGDVILTLRVAHAPPPTPAPPLIWKKDYGVNYFYGCKVDNKTWVDLGRVDSVDACQTMCQKVTNCKSYTWHDPSQGTFAKLCVGRTDGFYTPQKENGHDSGRISSTKSSDKCKGGNPDNGLVLAAIFLDLPEPGCAVVTG